jgi:hypothetical protein
MEPLIRDINHVGLAVHDMAVAASRLESLGFALTPLSAHKGATRPGEPVVALGSANRCAIFGTDYLEVLTHADPSRPDPRQERFLARHEGAHIICFGTDDTPAADRLLAGAGARTSGVIPLQRDVDTPEGVRTARFERTQIDMADAPEGLIQVARHLTPQYVHQARYQRHPNGVTGLSASFIVADDAEACAARYARWLGRPVRPGADGLQIDMTPVQRLVVLDPARALERLGETPASALPVIAAVAFATPDPAAQLVRLRDQGVSFKEREHGLLVPAAFACGAVMIFEELRR